MARRQINVKLTEGESQALEDWREQNGLPSYHDLLLSVLSGIGTQAEAETEAETQGNPSEMVTVTVRKNLFRRRHA